MRYIAPMTLKDAYFDPLETEIKRILERIIYIPLMGILSLRHSGLPGQRIFNSINPLIAALEIGTVFYRDGYFQGKFNARLSKALRDIGAMWDARRNAWRLNQADVPVDIKMANVRAESRFKELQRRMLGQLEISILNVNETIGETSRIQGIFEKAVKQMELQLNETLPRHDIEIMPAPLDAKKRIIVEANLTAEQTRIIAKDYTQNLEMYIKGWAEKNILDLREKIQPHVLAGGRANDLVKALQDNYGVGLNKAKFLARQETALLMSKFQETRYKDIGITRYRWSTAHDERVRPDHARLNGKTFSWDSPPITNQKSGARNNPGSDYNCRCVAIPLVE